MSIRRKRCLRSQPLIAEVEGEPVEQLGVGGEFAGDAEVAGASDQAGAEDVLPEAIDGDAGGERVVGVEQPSGEAEPVSGPRSRRRRARPSGVSGLTGSRRLSYSPRDRM